MKKSTKIIGSILLVTTGVGIYFLTKNKKPNTINGKYIYENGNQETNIVFNPKIISDTLYEAMNTTGKGALNTDKNVIFDTLSDVSPNQFKAVVKAFSLRPYNLTFGNQRYIPPFKLKKYGLKVWLKNELSIADYTRLRKNYPNSL